MKDTSIGAHIFESMIKWITETKFDSLKLIEVTTDERPAVIGEKNGFVALQQ